MATLLVTLLLAAAGTEAAATVQGMICVANGRTYAQGETACIELPCQTPYLARCTMVLNNSSWQKVADECPVTRAPDAPGEAMTPWRLASQPEQAR